MARPAAQALLALVVLVVFGARALARAPHGSAQAGGPEPERWRFELLLGPGADDRLPFEVEFDPVSGAAFLVNGPERSAVPSAVRTAESWRLDFPHFDARLELAPAGTDATREADGTDGAGTDGTGRAPWRGTYTRRRSANETASLVAVATPADGRRFPAGAPPAAAVAALAGTWRVDFASSDAPAVGVFEIGDEGRVTGTIRTVTGDLRYLAGDLAGDRLRLSVFDGAHAMRFDARLVPPAGDAPARLVEGRFRSGSWYEEAFTAVRDDGAHLPDPLARAALLPTAHLEFLAFPDARGALQPVWRPGRPAVIEVFGTWCPNCHDAAALLADLHRRHGPRGLDVVGLAFEVTGEFARDAAQLERFAEHTGAAYPLLLCGTADKARAAAALGLTERIEAFPTTFFVDAGGAVVAVWSGFDGPATGAAHTRLCEDVERLVLDLLASAARAPLEARLAFERGDWLRPPLPPSDEHARARFAADARAPGVLVLETELVVAGGVQRLRQRGSGAGSTFEVEAPREAARGRTPFGFESRLVARGGVLIEAVDLRRRWAIAGQRTVELLPEQGVAALGLVDPLLRAEGAFALAFAEDELVPAAVDALAAALADRDAWVRAHAAAALATLAPAAPWRTQPLADALVLAAADPSPLVRGEAAAALGSLGLAPELWTAWQASAAPAERALAARYARATER